MPVEAIVNAAYFTIRAGGRTFITFLFDSFFTWVIPVPVALMLSRLTSLDVMYMYLVIQTLEIIKVVVGFIILRSGIWCKKFVSDGAEPQEIAPAEQAPQGDLWLTKEEPSVPKGDEWLAQENEPTTVVEAENDFLDENSTRDLL